MKNYDFLKEILPYPTWYSSTQSTRRQTDPHLHLLPYVQAQFYTTQSCLCYSRSKEKYHRESNFQYRFSVMGHLGSKENFNFAKSILLLKVFFYIFMGKRKNKYFLYNAGPSKGLNIWGGGS